MLSPQNMLDHLADCATVCGEEFPGTIFKCSTEGANGQTTTQSLLVFGEDGNTYLVSVVQVPDDQVSEFTAGAHPI